MSNKVLAAYLTCGTGIRFKDNSGVEIKWLEQKPPIVNDLSFSGQIKASDVKHQADQVFQLVPVRMSKLVIVNSNLSSFEILQTVADLAMNYADEVMVIPALLARLSYALESLATPIRQYVPPDEKILVATMVEEFVEYIILKRNLQAELYVSAHEIYEHIDHERGFREFLQYHRPTTTIIVALLSLENAAFNLETYCGGRCYVKLFKKWDHMLFFGGIFRSMSSADNYDERYQIPNFTDGYQISIENSKREDETVNLLLERSPVPSDFRSMIDAPPQQIQITYCPVFNQYYDRLIWETRFATEERNTWFSGDGKTPLGYVDERGVPYATPRTEAHVVVNNEEPKEAAQIPPQTNQEATSAEVSNQINSSLPRNYDDLGPFASKESNERSLEEAKAEIQPTPDAQTLSQTNNLPQKLEDLKLSKNSEVAFVFEQHHCSVRYDNPQIPDSMAFLLYLSVALGKPLVGETAKEHLKWSPQSVVYDIFEVIGKRMEEIEMNPKWKFEVKERENGEINFQIMTPKGARQIPQDLLLSAFMKVLKMEAEAVLKKEPKEISILTFFELNESQKAIFQKAAMKNHLDVLSFDVL